MSALTVIIPSKTASNLVPCVAAVWDHEPDARIIVIDDGVQFDSRLHVLQPPVEAIPGVKPFVFARNINLGIRAAGDSDVVALDDIVLLNDDAILESHRGFSLLQSAAQVNPQFGIIGATTDLTGQPLQRRKPETDPGWGLREVEHIAFVCVLIPAETRLRLKQVGMQGGFPFTGGFLDERYTGYGSDDLDYCMQVRAAGLKVGVHDGCYVNHGTLKSSYRGLPTAAGNIWPNHRILREKWGMPPNPQDPEYQRLWLEWQADHL